MIDSQEYAYGEGYHEPPDENYTSNVNSSDEEVVSSKRHRSESGIQESAKHSRSYPSSRDSNFRHDGWNARGRGFQGNFPPNMNYGMHPMMGNMMGMMFNPAMGMGMYGMGPGFDYNMPPQANFNQVPPPYQNEGRTISISYK